MADTGSRPNVALFVTCLVDLFRPSVGFAAVRLLEQAGCEVAVPHAQTCCGQPAYNSGDRADAAEIARRTIPALLPFDYVVAPSGSCAGMIRKHWPTLFENDQEMSKLAISVAEKTWELTSFLTDVCGMETVDAAYDGVAAYHDSCSGLRELGVREQPRKLLDSVKGLTVKDLAHPEECCGFGGTFAVKYPDISGRMVSDKAEDIEATGADTLLAGDLGCLMNMAGKLKRRGSAIKVRHVAELLAGDTDAPPIGEGEK
ncbi:MAG: (Fe-S)-binding protein [Pseudomonadota bacterium]